MSAVRSYAEVVADLRGCADVDDGAGFHLNATVQREAAVLLAGVAAALPPCPTCGGTGKIHKQAKLTARTEWTCPDCDHGKVTVAQLAAENAKLRAALDEAQLRSIEARNPGIDMDEVRRIRSVRPVAPSPEEGT